MDLFNKKKVSLLESKIALRENERDSYKRQLNEMMQEYKMLNLSIEAFLKNVYEGKYLKYLVSVSYTPSEKFLDYSYIKCVDIKVEAGQVFLIYEISKDKLRNYWQGSINELQETFTIVSKREYEKNKGN